MAPLALILAFLAALGLPAHAAAPMPPVDPATPIYEVPVEPGVSAEDVVTSLKVAADGKNFVSPAAFPLAEHLKQRGIAVGVLEVHSYCSLGIGSEILLDHPEFAVFAPCRIALYEKQGRLWLALDRPTFDLTHIKNPTERARRAARELEDTLIWIMDQARSGDL